MTSPSEHRAQARFVSTVLGVDERDWRAALISELHLREGDTVVDIGSGPGCSVTAIKGAMAGRVVCVDTNLDMLTGARSSDPDILCVAGRAESLPFQSRSMGAALCAGTLHSTVSQQRCIHEAARVVKIGGHVVIGNKGIGPWFDGTAWYDHTVLCLGDDAREWPPLHLLPVHIDSVVVRWPVSPAFYVLRFRVTE